MEAGKHLPDGIYQVCKQFNEPSLFLDSSPIVEWILQASENE
jgi:hypothetical protein